MAVFHRWFYQIWKKDHMTVYTAMSITAALLLERFEAGAFPIAVVSMDNCSHNGEKLRNSVS